MVLETGGLWLVKNYDGLPCTAGACRFSDLVHFSECFVIMGKEVIGKKMSSLKVLQRFNFLENNFPQAM